MFYNMTKLKNFNIPQLKTKNNKFANTKQHTQSEIDINKCKKQIIK